MTDVTLRYLLFGDDKTATKALKNLGKNAHSTMATVSKGASMIGLSLGAVGIAAFAKSAVDLEAKFSQTMSMIAAATHAPAAEMKGMNDLAMKLGAATSFSAGEAADAMLELAKAGLNTKTIMGGGVQGTLQLAAAGGTELATAATIASNAMNTFNLKGKDMASIAAALAGGANASSASVESLGMALSQVGPGAKNAGLSLQETVGALAAFDSAGIKGADAGTSLKTMLSRLIPTTIRATNAMDMYGLSFVKRNGEFVSLSNVAAQLHNKLGGLSEAERAHTLQVIFGSDATRAATVLMNEGSKGLAKFIRATKDQSAAQDMANARMSGTKGALERMSGAIETAKLALGQGLAPTVQSAANVMTTQLVPAFTGFVQGMQTGTGAGGDFANILGGIKSAAMTVAPILGNMLKIIVEHPDAAKAALLGLAAAFVVVKVVALATAVSLKYTAAATAISTAATRAHTVATAISMSTLGTWIGVKAIELGAWVASLPAKIADTAATVAHTVAVGAAATVAGVWTAAQWLLNAALTANPIGLIIVAIAALVAGLIIAYKKSDTFRKIVNAAFHGVQVAASFAFNWVKQHWPLILAILTGPIGIAVLIIAKNWDKIKAGVMGVVNFVKSIPGRLRDLGSSFGSAGRWLIDKFLSGLSKAGSFVGDFASGVWDAVKSMINSGIDRINSALDFTIDLPGPKNLHVDVANIPHLAAGGIVKASRGGTLAVLGEGGYDEAVIPLGGSHSRGAGGDLGEVVVVVMNEDGEVIERKLAKVKRSKRGGRRLAFESA